MSNLSNNRLNTTATAAQITAVKTALQTISTNLPFLLGLPQKSALPYQQLMLTTKLLPKMLLMQR